MTPLNSKPEFVLDEEVFFTLLTHINLSEERIMTLTKLALRFLPQSIDVWSAIRKALIEQSTNSRIESLNSDHIKALWMLVNCLMRSAPHVFIPLILPRLQEYVIHEVPWGSLLWHEGGSGEWWEALIFSWESILPANVFVQLKRHLLQQRTGSQLDSVVVAKESPSNANEAATEADLNLLMEEWHSLQSLCTNSSNALSRQLLFETLAAGDNEAAAAATTWDLVREVELVPSSEAGALEGVKNSKDDQIKQALSEEDDEYEPEFAFGAKPRELPDLGLPAPRRRREARQRLREDEF